MEFGRRLPTSLRLSALVVAFAACSSTVVPVADGEPMGTSDTALDVAVDETAATDTSSDLSPVAIPDPGTQCGDGTCNALETIQSCATDCAFLLQRYGGPCAKPGKTDVCPNGYICVPRNTATGGNICVADFDSWPPLPDAHPASDFTESADFVVDNWTHLTWAKASLPAMSSVQALSACTTQTYGGFEDWRAPTLAELASLVDRSAVNPACSAPNLQFVLDRYYWSASSAPGNAAFEQDFVDGYQTYDGVDPTTGLDFANPVRCVRADQASQTGAGTRYLKQDQGLTVLDRTTGLHWQWYYSSTEMSYADAVSWCNHDTPGLPSSGWRLPTAGELFQLTDRQFGQPTLGPVFASPKLPSFWTSTSLVAPNLAWQVSLGAGGGVYTEGAKTEMDLARCVRK